MTASTPLALMPDQEVFKLRLPLEGGMITNTNLFTLLFDIDLFI